MTGKNHLFCLGLGFTTITLGRALLEQGWQVSGTTRSPEKARQLEGEGFGVVVLDNGAGPSGAALLEASHTMSTASHIVNSTPPNEEGDPFVSLVAGLQGQDAVAMKWFGYLSTIGVYGEHHGAWIDEGAELRPVTRRSQWRVRAEQQWQQLANGTGLPLHIFRLPGIYGPGRNQMETLLKGKSRRLVKKGQVFNRIHVDDIAQTVAASMASPAPGGVYNVSDDLPCPPQDVVALAASLLGMDPPPIVPYETAELSDMARSFYGECKRVRNGKIKQELGIRLKYPSYKEGLPALHRQLKTG